MTTNIKATISHDGTIEITSENERPTAVVVFAHGLGDTAHGWADTMAAIAKELPHVKFVLPTAAKMPVTVNGGAPMHAWFDIKGLNEGERKEARGTVSSQTRLLSLIENEVAGGIPHNRIVLGGFSQGAAMSLYTGFQMKRAALAGVLCLSGRIPQVFEVAQEATQVPLLMCHGALDPVVTLAWGQQAKQTLEAAGVSGIEMIVYPDMRHSICAQEVEDIKRWLQRVIPPV